MEIAVDRDARILGLRGRLIHDHGAYTARGVNVPYSSAAALTLPYVVPAYHLDIVLAVTNKVAVTPVRGAGQPQARLRHGAAARQGGARTRSRPCRGAPPQSRPARGDALCDPAHHPRRHAGGARQRRLSGLPGRSAGTRRLERVPRAPTGLPRRGPAHRHGARQLCRRDRARSVRTGQRAHRRKRPHPCRQRCHRHGPEHQDDAGASRRRRARRRYEQYHRRDRRFRGDRARHRRLSTAGRR